MSRSWVRGIQEENTLAIWKMPGNACEWSNFMTLPLSGAKCVSPCLASWAPSNWGKGVKKEALTVQIFRLHYGICDWTWFSCLEHGLVSRTHVSTVTEQLWPSRKAKIGISLLQISRRGKERQEKGWLYLEFCFLHLAGCTVQDLLTLGVKKELSVLQHLMA